MPLNLIDIGANLTHQQFAKDRGEVLERAWAAGVQKIVLTGCSEGGSRAAQALAEAHPERLYSTAGVHPHDAKACRPETLAVLQDLAQTPEVVAIGECGLDYNRDFSPREVQRTWFEAQLALARELEMPVFLHERDAHEDFLAILSDYKEHLPAAVVHCFTGERAALEAYLELDCYIGITGWICDERRGGHLKELVGLIPEDRLLIETDAPFLLPRDLRPRPKSRRNEPAYLPHILGAIAACLDVASEELAAQTTQNAETFFGI